MSVCVWVSVCMCVCAYNVGTCGFCIILLALCFNTAHELANLARWSHLFLVKRRLSLTLRASLCLSLPRSIPPLDCPPSFVVCGNCVRLCVAQK